MAPVMARRMSVSILIFAHAVLRCPDDFPDGHAVGFLHVAAELADFGQQFLRHRGGTVHHQMGVGDAGVDFGDAVDGEDVAGGLLGELVGAVAGADGDGEGVAVGLLDEVGGLLDVGEELFAVMVPSAPWPSSCRPSWSPENPGRPVRPRRTRRWNGRTSTTTFGDVDVVFVGGDGLAVGL